MGSWATTSVGILLYDEVEVLDCCGPFEVFSTASRVARRLGSLMAPFEVHTVAAHGVRVVARGGLRLLAAHTLDDAPPLDGLVVPGGVTAAVEADDRVVDWIGRPAGRTG